MHLCINALRRFYKGNWRCEKQIDDNSLLADPYLVFPDLAKYEDLAARFSFLGLQRNSKDAKRCVNYQDGHQKGHQYLGLRVQDRTTGLNETPTGRLHTMLRASSKPILEVGEFEGSFNVTEYMKSLESEVQVNLTRTNLSEFYKPLALRHKIGRVFSNTTCLGCLSRRPTHILTCGHMFCQHCISRFGDKSLFESHSVTLQGCPLGCASQEMAFHFKPSNAGIRTLALDGYAP